MRFANARARGCVCVCVCVCVGEGLLGPTEFPCAGMISSDRTHTGLPLNPKPYSCWAIWDESEDI